MISDETAAEIGQAIETAAGELPDRWSLLISVERGAAGVELVTPYGDDVDSDEFDGPDLAESIRAAVEYAFENEREFS